MIVVCSKCNREGLDVSMHRCGEEYTCHLCDPEGAASTTYEGLANTEGYAMFIQHTPQRMDLSIRMGEKHLHFRAADGNFALWGSRGDRRLPKGAQDA